MLNALRMNMRIIRVFNSCSRNEFTQLVDDVISDPKAKLILSSKRYVWNIIRPRDYYKMMTYYIVELLENPDSDKCHRAEALMEIVLSTTKSEEIRKHFVWNIMKHIPVLTIHTIRYASEEKILNILQNSDNLIIDDYIRPFITMIWQQKNDIEALRTQLDIYQS